MYWWRSYGIVGLKVWAFAINDLITSVSTLLEESSVVGACNFWWTWVTCFANLVSKSVLALSRRRKIKSNLESKAADRLMFWWGRSALLYLPYTGFAAANIDVRAFKEVVMPLLAIEIVYCSITSWMLVLSLSSILSNSSIQQIPLSVRTSAPPSSTTSPVVGSFMTAAVRPALEDPFPLV